MKVSGTATLIIGMAAALIGAGLLTALASRPERSEWWTDGDQVRVPVIGASVREVLWRPAELLKGVEFGVTDEYEPRYSADGTVVVFVRRRPGQNADLYSAHWSSGGWSKPSSIESINTTSDELGPELSRDGQWLYFYSDRPGGLGGYDLWRAEFRENEWSNPTNLGPEVNTRWNEYGPALTPSHDRLYFSSNRPRPGEPITVGESWNATIREHRTRHDYDIYVADLSSGSATNAHSVDSLNTGADEGAPTVSPPGDFLYLASDRIGSIGGFDLYRARLKQSGQCGPIENLGSSINSSANDLDPTLSSDGFRLSFSSDRAPEIGAPSGSAEGQGATTEPGRYSLWTSRSCEVYHDVQIGESRGSVPWWNIWRWLVLALALAPLVFLYRLMREQTWRRRFAQLSLMAQCVLISLFVHAGIASALAVWKVGSGMIESLHPGGGNRVVLTSGADRGSIAGQIRALTTGDALSMSEPDHLDMPAVHPLSEASSTQLKMAEFTLPAVTTLSVPIRTIPERTESLKPTNAAPTPDMEPSAIPNSTSPRITTAEQRTELPPLDVQMGDVSTALIPSGPMVEVPLPTYSGRESGQGPAPAIAPANTRGSQHVIGSKFADPQPQSLVVANAPAMHGTRLPVSEAVSTSERIPAADSAPAPIEVSEVQSRPVEVAIDSMNSSRSGNAVREGAPLQMEVKSSPSGVHQDGAAVRASVMSAPGPDLNSGPPPYFPKLAQAVPSSSGEPTTQQESTSSMSAVPAPVQLPFDSSKEAASTYVDPGRMSFTEAATASSNKGRLNLITELPQDRSTLAAGARAGSSTAPMATVTPAPGIQIPVGIPTPKETFDQRAPESRAELVAKMGGSQETERAVGRALEWFARHQDGDGHWSAEDYDRGCGECTGGAEFKADAAMTGMVLLCYLGAGHTHTQDGPYRDAVCRGLKWLIERQALDGDMRRGETMYGQTAGAVALCEAFAMTRDPALAEPARRAVSFVLARAARQQSSSDRDRSVLGWLVFTVESARRAGFEVPRTTFEAARQWLDYVGEPGAPGRYAYAKGGEASAAMTAEAMFVQQLLGRTRDEPMMQQSAQLVLRTPPKWQEGAPTYYWYYATLALFQHQGDGWKQWNDQLVQELLAHQERDGKSSGSWAPTDPWSRMGGRVYQTAVCTLSLEVYYRYKAK